MSHKEATCPPTAQPSQAQTHVIPQLVSTLIALQQTQQQILKLLAIFIKPSPSACSTSYRVIDQRPLVGGTIGNVDSLSATRWPTSVTEEPTIFMTRLEVEVMLKREKEKAYASSMDLKPPYSTEVAASRTTNCPNSRSLTARRTIQGSMMFASLIRWILTSTMLIFS